MKINGIAAFLTKAQALGALKQIEDEIVGVEEAKRLELCTRLADARKEPPRIAELAAAVTTTRTQLEQAKAKYEQARVEHMNAMQESYGADSTWRGLVGGLEKELIKLSPSYVERAWILTQRIHEGLRFAGSNWVGSEQRGFNWFRVYFSDKPEVAKAMEKIRRIQGEIAALRFEPTPNAVLYERAQRLLQEAKDAARPWINFADRNGGFFGDGWEISSSLMG